jgi:hypothetical protein
VNKFAAKTLIVVHLDRRATAFAPDKHNAVPVLSGSDINTSARLHVLRPVLHIHRFIIQSAGVGGCRGLKGLLEGAVCRMLTANSNQRRHLAMRILMIVNSVCHG